MEKLQLNVPPELSHLSHKKLLEAAAGLLVGAVTGTSLEELDPGGGAVQLPDFEILASSGGTRIGVMEVTTTTRADRASYGAQVHRENWEYPNLKCWWLVHTDGSTRPRDLRIALEPILEAWETGGPPTQDWIPIRPGLVHPEAGALPTDLVELGVVAITAMPPGSMSGKSWVSVQRQGQSGAFNHRTALTGEVQAELNKADNQAKLQGNHGRAELFVWLDVGDGAAAATTLCDPPWDQTLSEVALPILPVGITAVWAGVGLADWPQPASALLRFDGHRWELIPRPTL